MIRHAVSRVFGLIGARRRGPTILTVAAEPETALLASAAALRRLGARIARYETEAGRLEARLGAERIRLAATRAGEDTSRLHVETDGPGAGALVRRLRRELTHPTPEVTQ